MYYYINKILLESLSDDMWGTSAAPMRSYLFKVDKTNTDKLDTAMSDLFYHYSTVQILFLSKQHTIAQNLTLVFALSFLKHKKLVGLVFTWCTVLRGGINTGIYILHDTPSVLCFRIVGFYGS